ncbi:MAG TPA: alpha/beta family hydrolase, partial [Deferrisomatales bacterium]|nr:alpha/beta family hydrolase [Deferrisomatales bacterium]
MVETRLTIPVGDAAVSAILSAPAGAAAGAGVVLAHGAGNDMETPFLAGFAAALGWAGHPVLRFNFPYRERGRRAPDRAPLLEAAWRAAWEAAGRRAEFAGVPRVAAGKSMGGRIATRLVATGGLVPAGLLLLGYPLHPAGHPEK